MKAPNDVRVLYRTFVDSSDLGLLDDRLDHLTSARSGLAGHGRNLDQPAVIDVDFAPDSS